MKQSRILNFIEPRNSYNEGKAYSLLTWRKKVTERDGNKCQNCANFILDGHRNRNFSNEAHHVVPRHHGGKNVLNNGITLCKFCHQYFDYSYFRFGLDYHEIQSLKPKEKIISEVKRLMKRRYVRHLLNLTYT